MAHEGAAGVGSPEWDASPPETHGKCLLELSPRIPSSFLLNLALPGVSGVRVLSPSTEAFVSR